MSIPPSAFAASSSGRRPSKQTQLDGFLSDAAKSKRKQHPRGSSRHVTTEFSKNSASNSKSTGSSFMNSSPNSAKPPVGYLSTGTANDVAQSNAKETSLGMVKSKPTFTQKLCTLLSPRGLALFNKEMPAPPGFGCENATSSKAVPKNLKRQENQHAVHFRATKKWSKLLEKARVLKKHNACYIQRMPVCCVDECPVATKKVHRFSGSRTICKLRVFAFRAGFKSMKRDLVNLDLPQCRPLDATDPDNLAVLARKYNTEKDEMSKYRAKLDCNFQKVSARADQTRDVLAKHARSSPNAHWKKYQVGYRPRYGLDAELFYAEGHPARDLPHKSRLSNNRYDTWKSDSKPQRVQKPRLSDAMPVANRNPERRAPEKRAPERRVHQVRAPGPSTLRYSAIRVSEAKVPDLKTIQREIPEFRIPEEKAAETISSPRVETYQIPTRNNPNWNTRNWNVPKAETTQALGAAGPELKSSRGTSPQSTSLSGKIPDITSPRDTRSNLTSPKVASPDHTNPWTANHWTENPWTENPWAANQWTTTTAYAITKVGSPLNSSAKVVTPEVTNAQDAIARVENPSMLSARVAIPQAAIPEVANAQDTLTRVKSPLIASARVTTPEVANVQDTVPECEVMEGHDMVADVPAEVLEVLEEAQTLLNTPLPDFLVALGNLISPESTLPKSIAESAIPDHGDKVVAEIEEIIPEIPLAAKKEPPKAKIAINFGKSQSGIASRKAALFDRAAKANAVKPTRIPEVIKVALKHKSEVLNGKFEGEEVEREVVAAPFKKLDLSKFIHIEEALSSKQHGSFGIKTSLKDRFPAKPPAPIKAFDAKEITTALKDRFPGKPPAPIKQFNASEITTALKDRFPLNSPTKVKGFDASAITTALKDRFPANPPTKVKSFDSSAITTALKDRFPVNPPTKVKGFDASAITTALKDRFPVKPPGATKSSVPKEITTPLKDRFPIKEAAPVAPTPVKVAPVKVAPVAPAPVKVAPVKVAPVKVAPVKVASVKAAPNEEIKKSLTPSANEATKPVHIVKKIAAAITFSHETKVDSWLHKPKSQLWVELKLEALFIPHLDKNTFELQCLSIDLKMLCKTEAENKLNEYLAYLRLVVSVEKHEETLGGGKMVGGGTNRRQAPTFINFLPEEIAHEVVNPCSSHLLQLQAAVRAQDSLMNKCKKTFLAQFSVHERIEAYLLTLLESVQATGKDFVKVCTDIAGDGSSDETLAHYEHTLSTMMEDMETMEYMDYSAKESIGKIEAGFGMSLANVIQGHNDAYTFKERYSQQFYNVWMQALRRRPLSSKELDDLIGCLSSENQNSFSEECHHLRAHEVSSQKLERIKALHHSVSRARADLQSTFEKVTSRFATHVYESHGVKRK